MRVALDYGKAGIEAEVPDDAEILSMAPMPGLDRIEERLFESLRTPSGAAPLLDLARGRSDACVVISDITRPVPNSVILPPILATLENAGMARDAITILIATGLHRPNEGEELLELVGPEIAQEYRIENHRARDRGSLAYVGETSAGAPIWVDRLYLEADLKIATSLIEPHLMAGYSGGRKAICPGLMGVDTVKVLHGPELMGHPGSAEGIIEGNPFHQQALEVARTVGVDFTLNVAMNEERRITGIFCGDLEKAHAEGVEFVEEAALATVDEAVDVVVTTSAGFPLDLTFYQAVKGMTSVLPILREGGTIVIAASCDEGLGSREFSELLLQTSGLEEFAEKLESPDFFVVDQWQLQELCKVLATARVKLYSPKIARDYGATLPMVDVVPSVEAGITEAFRGSRGNPRVAVVPKGPYVLPRLSSGR